MRSKQSRSAIAAASVMLACAAGSVGGQPWQAHAATVIDAPAPTAEASCRSAASGERCEKRRRPARRETRKRRDNGSPKARHERPAERPAEPAPAGAAELSDGNPDPFRTLGAGSPFCKRAGVRARAGCHISGSIAHPYPISNYGLDIQVQTGVTKVEDNLLAALQSVGALLWLGLVYALKGVLLLLEWAFSLDLLNEAMRPVRRALEALHRGVLGTPWFMTALAVAGLWGIWQGLLRRRSAETISGLAATVALMVAALVVIANPAGTVGHASRLANEASLGFMSAASTGSTERPAQSFARASQRLFDALVLAPWCALQFGDVDYCERRRSGGFSNADLWLAFPAEGKERQALYKLTRGEDPDDGGFLADVRDTVGGVIKHGPAGLSGALLRLADGGAHGGELPASVKRLVQQDEAKVRMQEKGGTFTRIALLAIVALGLLGAICLLLYLAVKLVLAGLMSLILLLLAPAMLLAPAFGESGRATFIGWAKRLVGALAAKLIYSLLLAVVVVAATTLAALEVGWFGTWLLQVAFWWGILIKRHDLTGFLSAGQGDEPPRTPAHVRAYQTARSATALAAATKATALAGPSRARGRASEMALTRGQAERRATATAAQDKLAGAAERDRGLQLAGARETLARRAGLQRERKALDAELTGYERNHARAGATGQEPRPPTAEEELMLARRAALERALDSDLMRHAERTVAQADRAQASEGRALTRHDVEAWREQRRRDLEQGLPPEHERSLRAAGIDPRDYATADPGRRGEMVDHSRAAAEQHRELLAALPREGAGQPTPAEIGRARSVLSPADLRPHRRTERARAAHERHQRTRRHGLYRR